MFYFVLIDFGLFFQGGSVFIKGGSSAAGASGFVEISTGSTYSSSGILFICFIFLI